MDLLRNPLFSSAARLLRFRKRHPPIGAMPGTLVTLPDSPPPRISIIRYGVDLLEEKDLASVEGVKAELDGPGVLWVDVQGLGDEETLRALGEIFRIHPLALEDAVNIPQRPKSETYEDQHLFIARMTQVGQEERLDAEQISFFVGPNYLLTLQERYGDVFDPVRRRIRAGKGPIRRMGPDYLAYALIDMVIDGYYPLIEKIGDQLYELEEQVLVNPTRTALHNIHAMRRELLAIRRAVWPLREAVQSLIREESPLITDPVRQYLRDCQDHAVQVVDVLETYREITSSLMDIHLSSTGQRTNEVMKVLTIMASIFIPLTFVAGVYGMNFEYLPELHVRWAYPAVLAIMIAVAVGMLWYFRRKGWIGNQEDS